MALWAAGNLGSVLSIRTMRATPRCRRHSLGPRLHVAAGGPHAKRSIIVEDGVAASLGCFVPVVHDQAPARAPVGNARVQVAASSHPDEPQVRVASRTLHFWREQVIPHGRFWHCFIPSPQTSGGMPDNTSDNWPRASFPASDLLERHPQCADGLGRGCLRLSGRILPSGPALVVQFPKYGTAIPRPAARVYHVLLSDIVDRS